MKMGIVTDIHMDYYEDKEKEFKLFVESLREHPFIFLKKKEQDALNYIRDNVDKYKNYTKICVTHFNFHCDEGLEGLIANPNNFEFIKDNFDYLITGHSLRRVFKTFGKCTVINAGADYEKSPTLKLFYEEIEV